MDVRRILAGLAAVPLVLLAVLLGACGSGGSSVADPPVSSAPTTSDPTTRPHHESAKHFIRRWVDVEKAMENTGQTKAYLATSHSCKACVALASQIRRFYDAGGYVQWGGWRILSIEVNGHTSSGLTTFAVRNRSFPTTYKESSSSRVKHLSGGVTTELLTLSRVNGNWNVHSKAELAS